jgi:hypothetical protein
MPSNQDHVVPLLEQYDGSPRPRSGSSVRSESPTFELEIEKQSSRRREFKALTICFALFTSLLQYLKAFGLFLLPSFIQSRLISQALSSPLHPTASLDGLRGTAAFIVFIFHFFLAYTGAPLYGYGSSSENRHWHQLPILKIMYAGDFMVVLFFIISGYVLTTKPLRLACAGSAQSANLLKTLSSSTFRRGMRLFVPTMVGTFVSMVLLQLGAFEPSRRMLAWMPSLVAGMPGPHPQAFPTFYEGLIY